MHRASWIMYLGSLIAAVLAMKTKEIAITLPAVIVLYEFMFFGKIQNSELSPQRVACGDKTQNFKRILYLIPLLLTMLIIPLSIMGIDRSAGEILGDINEETKGNTQLSRLEYLTTGFRVVVTYIRLLFSPINQNLDYDYPKYNSISTPSVFISFMVLLSIFGMGIYLLYRSRVSVLSHQQSAFSYKLSAMSYQRIISFGIFWFFITLSVESSFIPLNNVIFEHRLYLPSIGFIISFGTALFYVLQLVTVRLNGNGPKQNIFPFLTVNLSQYSSTALIVLFSVATYQRNTIWNDRVSLWEDVVKKSPAKARGYYNLGNAHREYTELDKAVENYRTALMLKQDYGEAHNNLGLVYDMRNQPDRAIEHYQLALKLNPGSAMTHHNLGITYLGIALVDEAIEQFRIALRLKPDYTDAHLELGNAYYFYKGMLDEAIEHYQAALRLDPNNPKIHLNIGIIFREKGWINISKKHIDIAKRLKPDLFKK